MLVAQGSEHPSCWSKSSRASSATILDDLCLVTTADTPKRQLELVNEPIGDAAPAGLQASAVAHSASGGIRRCHRSGGCRLCAFSVAVQRDQQFRAAPELGLGVAVALHSGQGFAVVCCRRSVASWLRADQVDVLVSFITVSGVRKLQDVLQQITAMGAQQDGRAQPKTRLRILTTTYTGATEARALDELARLPGCEVRVSLDGRRTRLHAKAWLFQRKTGFGSAYVGSANLSGAALTGGLEWTVKLTQRAQEALYARAIAHFETLWADSEFQRYDPDNVEHRQALASSAGS